MPRVLSCDPGSLPPRPLDEAARVLRGGGLVAFPTETVYGLGALATDERALARVFAAKGRPIHHPLIAHVEGEAQARAICAGWPELASALARAFWPGPLTLILDRAAHVPAAISGGASSIAVRVPSHPVARALLAAVGGPVAAPSANRYQGLSPTTAAHVVKELGDRVDLVLDGGACDAGIESTVVDVRAHPPVVLRPGAASLEVLRTLAPSLVLARKDPEVREGRASPGMDARHYAPRAPLIVAPTAEAAATKASALLAASPGLPIGVVVLEASAGAGSALAGDQRLIVRTLPADAVAYGQALFRTLHDLDDAGVQAIVVQAVPQDPSWWAVADRLARGSTPLP